MGFFINQWSQTVNDYVAIREKKREEDRLYMKSHPSNWLSPKDETFNYNEVVN